MRSIAIFPCSYTFGASVIGELSNQLRLKVYNDEMLFSDVSRQFGAPAKEIKSMICGQTSLLNRYRLRKNRYVNLLKCSLAAQTMYSFGQRLYCGLHTSLLDSKKDRVLKILIFDDKEHRTKRATQQEGCTEKIARDSIQRYDNKVSDWTKFVVNKEAYDHSLYDIVFPLSESNPLHIITDIIDFLETTTCSQTAFQTETTFPFSDNHINQDNRVGYIEGLYSSTRKRK